MKRKKLIIILSIFFIIGVVGVGAVASLFLMPNVTVQSEKGEEFLLIYENTDMEELMTQIAEDIQIKNIGTFKLTSKLLKFTTVRSGRYRITDGMNNLALVRMLRNGKQTPVKLTFNNIRTKEQLAGRLSRQLMPDSVTILNLLNDAEFLQQYGLNPYTSVSLFLPDTYEVFWNVSAEKLFERMNKEYRRFWNDERKQKAAAIPLTQEEVSTLASIVDAETNVKAEKPIVAGLYINRLKKNMPLQADPTVIFGLGDFTIRRVLNVHTRSDSPYNTYKNTGLPPGPIRIPTITGLDAVLNYDKNDYIYMCAKETFNGEHNFAASWAEHKENAAKYQRALNARGIK